MISRKSPNWRVANREVLLSAFPAASAFQTKRRDREERREILFVSYDSARI
jgi:hypothetical protein